MPRVPFHRVPAWLLLCVLLALAGCGGDDDDGDGDTVPPPLGCSVVDQKTWLLDYMDAWYLWAGLSPRPDPAPYASANAYLQGLLYTGTDARFPRDRWSSSQSTESYNRFFGDGVTLGYGVAVAGLEQAAGSHSQLYIRDVDPGSPAAATNNIYRGDYVTALNGININSLLASGDLSLLTPRAVGDTLTLTYSPHGLRPRTEVLTAAIYPLQPVRAVSVLRSAGGRQVGYLVVQNMISQALAPLEAAFASFKAAGVQDVVLDLRYNGGGLVSAGATLASYVAGPRAAGSNYATLRYNAQRAPGNDSSFAFTTQASGLALPRIIVITGRRTCSASEQVINGLRGAGLEVVTIGETTCGKPVGSLPTSACGQTYSVINFESVNQRGEGRYFDGLAASCVVPDPYFFWGLGDGNETLLAAALQYADSGACPAVAASAGRDQAQVRRAARGRILEPAEPGGMVPR